MIKANNNDLAGKGEKCLSCNASMVNEVGSVKFNCPGCSNYQISRCAKCRKIVTRYTCPSCGFVGPN